MLSLGRILIILVTLPFVQSGYFEHVCLLINEEIISDCVDMVWQRKTGLWPIVAFRDVSIIGSAIISADDMLFFTIPVISTAWTES